MTATQQAPPKWRRFVPLLLLAGLAGGAAYLFREELGDEWAIRKFRRAAAAGDPNLPQHQEMLLKRLLSQEEKLDLAARLADDPDPKVRAAAVDVLLANQPRATKEDAPEFTVVTFRNGNWRARVLEAVNRLLQDEDETVRKKAVQAVAPLEWADAFQARLLDIMHTGSVTERVILAETLAHWDGLLLEEVVSDFQQPDEVRLAAMQSLETYGDSRVAMTRDELKNRLLVVLRSDNPELRRAAVVALRHADGSPVVWLDLLTDDAHKNLHPFVLRTWIDALGSETARVRLWIDSHTVWFQKEQDPRASAVGGYVLCEAAKRHIQHLEKSEPVGEVAALRDRTGPTGRAFDRQLRRLGYVLSALSAVRWYCETGEKAPEFAVWLPHETPNGQPPHRSAKAFLFQQAKFAWEWCLSQKDGYRTRFLTADSIVKSYIQKPATNPVPVRPLGAVLDELLLSQSDFDRLRTQYDAK